MYIDIGNIYNQEEVILKISHAVIITNCVADGKKDCVCIIEIRKEVQENQLSNQHGKNNKKKINIRIGRMTTFDAAAEKRFILFFYGGNRVWRQRQKPANVFYIPCTVLNEQKKSKSTSLI